MILSSAWSSNATLISLATSSNSRESTPISKISQLYLSSASTKSKSSAVADLAKFQREEGKLNFT